MLHGDEDRTDTEKLLDSWHNTTYWWGMALMFFGVCVVMNGIFTEVNNPPWDHVSPVLDFILFWSMLFWIAMLEGCQISVVGLQGYDPESFKDTHPRAYKCCKLVHEGPNVERFLVGRQFLLLFNGFLCSRVGGGTEPAGGYEMGDWTWSSEMTQFWYANNVMLMIVIVALGQLPCQLKDLLCWISGIDQSTADPAKAMKKDWFHWLRCGWSVFCVCFSGTFVIKGLALSQTPATHGAGWEHLPGAVAVLVAMFFIFMLASAEGIQVSVIALATVDGDTYRHKSPLAYRTAELALRGRNMSAFLVGRQFLTAMNMVLLARVTSYAGADGELLPGGDWGMGKFFNLYLLQAGFLGAIFVVNVAQLASQVTASIFPVSVINNNFMYWLLQLMLFIERLGIVNACWPLAYLLDRSFNMRPDPRPEDVLKETREKRGIGFTP